MPSPAGKWNILGVCFVLLYLVPTIPNPFKSKIDCHFVE